MEALTIYNARELTAAQEFRATWYDEFIAYIDRCDKTTRSYITNFRQFVAWMRYAGVTHPEREDIKKYREWLLKEHEAICLDPQAADGWKNRTDHAGNPIKITCKPNTVAQYIRAVCAFFKWASTTGRYENIADNIHAPKVRIDTAHRRKPLTAAEVLTVEESIAQKAQERTQTAQEARKDIEGRMQRSTEQGKRLYAMYLLAVNAGLRTVEISRANVNDLVTRGGQCCLYVWGKGHTEPDMIKSLVPEVAAAIKEYLQSRTDRPTGNSPLFVSTGNRSGGKRIAPTTISTMLKQALKEAGIDDPRITAHSLRTTTGTNAYLMTHDIYATQQYMRHADPATTERYINIETEKADAQMAERLYKWYHTAQE